MKKVNPILLFREETQAESPSEIVMVESLVEDKAATILKSVENLYQTLITKTREAVDASEYSDF
jgi:hypothetical protein